METEKKIEIAKSTISRFDNYYNGINSKGSFYLTLCTFIIGSAASVYALLHDKLALTAIHIGLLISLVIVAFASICMALIAVNPYLNSGNSSKYSSLLFFGSIARMKEREFCDEFDQSDIEKFYIDYKNQVFQLAKGLNKKFSIMFWVGRLVIIQFLLISIIIISFLTNNY